jgi:cytidylate kinase
MDGRDIGTTVFPNAELKIFVTADVDVRVERRYAELLAKGETVSREAVKENLTSRDLIDSTREFSPLKQADDAIVLNNSNITREQQLAIVMQWAKEKINAV